jgi:hypothetical protein
MWPKSRPAKADLARIRGWQAAAHRKKDCASELEIVTVESI